MAGTAARAPGKVLGRVLERLSSSPVLSCGAFSGSGEGHRRSRSEGVCLRPCGVRRAVVGDLDVVAEFTSL